MLKFIKSSIFFISILMIFQACGETKNANANTATTLGESTSITTNDQEAVMAPNPTTLKNIGQKVAEVLKSDINSLNENEATTFTKETKYCDISGFIDSQKLETVEKMTAQNVYKQCKTEKSLQDGNTHSTYIKMDETNKYPKEVTLKIVKDYLFNDIELKKELSVQANIGYENQKIKSIVLIINGMVSYQRGTYALQNSKHTIQY